MVKLKINDIPVEAPAGTTVLDAARRIGISIPTLCYLREINHEGACRMCVVEVKGARTLMSACTTAVSEGMEVQTHSETVLASRRHTLELLCANHHLDCEYCPRYSDCELHALLRDHGIPAKKLGQFYMKPQLDQTAPHLVRDTNRCLLCRRCVAVCHKQGVDAIALLGRGETTRVGAPLGVGNSNCVHCGQCTAVCPTGALVERDDTRLVRIALGHKDKHPVAIVAPAVWAAIGESFQDGTGVHNRSKLAAFLRRAGFERVYDLSRFPASGGRSAGISSTCPSVACFIRRNFPGMEECVSGAAIPAAQAAGEYRKRAAEELGVPEAEIVVVSISSCTAEKAEKGTGVDVSITTRELVSLLRSACVSRSTALNVWRHLSGEAYDNEDDASLPPVQAAQVSGLDRVGELLRAIRRGERPSEDVTLWACPGGCVNGGGQPRQKADVHNFEDLAAQRSAAL